MIPPVEPGGGTGQGTGGVSGEALFRALAEVSPAITFIYQGEQNVYANPAAERATGWSRAELLQMQFWDIIHPDSRELVRQRGMARQRGEPVPPTYEVRIQTRSGVARWLEFTGTTIVLDGQPAVLGTAVDVTERVEVRRALRVSEANYRRLFDNALVGVLQTTRAGEVLVANRAALEILGYESLEQLQAAGMPALYPDLRQRQQLLERLDRDGKVEAMEVLLRRRSGAEVLVETNVVLDGDVLSGVLVDVTERRRLEHEALRAQRLESLGVLAGGLAHDFNNFLCAILSNISLARHRARESDPAREWLHEAEQACQRARGLTQQLLTFARGGAPATGRVQPRQLLEEAVGFGLRGSRVACEWALPDQLPLLEVDEGQIAQVVHNLVINAVQAMPQGGRLRVGAEPLREERVLRLSFEDTGPGIPPGEQQRVFDPYYTTKPGGMGLGLATAHSIVRRHGGALRVESKPPEGARFLVDLPLAREQTPAPPPPVGGEELRGTGRILVMDDDDSIRAAALAILSELGYEAQGARDGAEAVREFDARRAAGSPFDLVLLDLTVRGGTGGLEALRQLQRLDPRVRAIVVSGYATDPVLARAAELGFAGRLHKPFTLPELGACVRDCLRR